MMSIRFACKTFFKLLGDREFADKVRALAQGTALPSTKPSKPIRSDAVQLLSVLQREGRLVDFLQESLDSYSDAQIGAAVRDVHRDTASALDRLLGIEALRPEAEGSELTLEADFDPATVRLTGPVSGEPPYRGRLRHSGWKVTRSELPLWSGSEASASVVAPAEVEIC